MPTTGTDPADRPTPISMGTFPRHAEFCAAFLPDPEHEDCALACNCGLDEMRRDLKAAEARSQGLEEALGWYAEHGYQPGRARAALGLPDEEGKDR